MACSCRSFAADLRNQYNTSGMKIAVITIAITCRKIIREKMDLKEITRPCLPPGDSRPREWYGFEPWPRARRVACAGGAHTLRPRWSRPLRKGRRFGLRPVFSAPRDPSDASKAPALPPHGQTGSGDC